MARQEDGSAGDADYGTIGTGYARYRQAEAGARLACSGWSFVPPEAVERFVATLGADLAAGAWDRDYGHLRQQAEFEGPLRLIIGRP